MASPSYAKIPRSFWTDPELRDLRHRNRAAFDLLLYLLTCHHGNLLGLYHLPAPYAAADLSWRPSRVKKLLAFLENEHVLMQDCARSLIFLPLVLQHQPIAGDKATKAALKIIQSLPETPLMKSLRGFLPPLLADLVQGDSSLVRPVSEGVSVGASRRTAAPTVTVSETEAGTVAVSSAEASKGNGIFHALMATANGLLGPPQTFGEKMAERVLRITGEDHRRDELLREFSGCSEAAVVAAVEDLEAGARGGRVENPGAYFWTLLKKHRAGVIAT